LPPPPEILANLKSLLAGGSFQEALAAAEDQTGLYVFWLDLHRISGKALEGLGLAACASALLLRAAAFRAAIPQIASLAFEDGTPFCSRETMDWLDSAGGGSGPAPSETARYDRFLEGDPAKSLSELGESAERPSTGRDGMLARAAEMLLYQRTGRAVEAAALARWAVGECGRLELAAYDPDCAARAMSSAACVLKGAGAEFKADYLKALEALARCGPRAVSGIPPAEIL
jgi:hypothetical protein